MFTVSIKTSGAAFEGFPEEEIARLLRGVADNVASGSGGGKIHDINGHTVGEWALDTLDDE